jgi:hypothetical protein
MAKCDSGLKAELQYFYDLLEVEHQDGRPKVTMNEDPHQL